MCPWVHKIRIVYNFLTFQFTYINRSPLVYRRDRESLPMEGAAGGKGKKAGYSDLA